MIRRKQQPPYVIERGEAIFTGKKGAIFCYKCKVFKSKKQTLEEFDRLHAHHALCEIFGCKGDDCKDPKCISRKFMARSTANTAMTTTCSHCGIDFDHETRYLLFKLISADKTRVYAVLSKNREDPDQSGVIPRHLQLGIIKWIWRWQRYAFIPEAETAFDTVCLEEIHFFINMIPEIAKRS